MFKIIIFIFISVNIFAQENDIKISVCNPMLLNKNVSTFLFSNNFSFEIYYSNENSNKYIFEIMTENKEESKKSDYIDTAIKDKSDYLLYTEVFSIEKNIFVDVKLINLLTNEIVYFKYFTVFLDIEVNDNISKMAISIIEDIQNLSLKKNFLLKKKENLKVGDISNNINTIYKSKHGFFVLNGFFKNNPKINSILNVYSGYTFYLSDGFYLESGFTLGVGRYDNDFSLTLNNYKDYFAGITLGFYFYLKGFIEPDIGFRADLLFNSNKEIFISIPIDTGMKIKINKNNYLKISTSFPFTSYSFNDFMWEKKFNLGIMLGYEYKI